MAKSQNTKSISLKSILKNEICERNKIKKQLEQIIKL